MIEKYVVFSKALEKILKGLGEINVTPMFDSVYFGSGGYKERDVGYPLPGCYKNIKHYSQLLVITDAEGGVVKITVGWNFKTSVHLFQTEYQVDEHNNDLGYCYRQTKVFEYSENTEFDEDKLKEMVIAIHDSLVLLSNGGKPSNLMFVQLQNVLDQSLAGSGLFEKLLKTEILY